MGKRRSAAIGCDRLARAPRRPCGPRRAGARGGRLAPARRYILRDDVVASNGTGTLLSFCMAGRDDDYTADFKYRLATTLEYLAASLRESNHWGKVEAVVVDWG